MRRRYMKSDQLGRLSFMVCCTHASLSRKDGVGLVKQQGGDSPPNVPIIFLWGGDWKTRGFRLFVQQNKSQGRLCDFLGGGP